jgi:hypothetical protein
MKKLLFLATCILTGTLVHANSNGNWISSGNWNKSTKNLRAATTVIDESFYDSIAMPYSSPTGARLDTLLTAKKAVVSIYPGIGFKFELTERKPITVLFSSDSISMFGFEISSSPDLSSPLYTAYSNGTSDTLNAGVYYMAIFTNFQYGAYNLKISSDTITPEIPSFEEVSFPLNLLNKNISFNNASLISINGFGTYPAVGFKFTVPKDTIFSAYFESNNINQYAFALSDSLPQSYNSSEFFGTTNDTLKAGTYYLTVITNYQFGDFNIFIHENEFDSLKFKSVILPYGVTNVACNGANDIISFQGNTIRAKGFSFTLTQDTTVITSYAITGSKSYSVDLYDSTFNLIQSSLDENDTISLSSGTYFLILASDQGPFTYDLSIKQKGEDIILSAKNELNDTYTIFGTDKTINIEGLSINDNVIVYSVDGYVVRSFSATSDIEKVSVPNTGLYIVNVNGKSKKLIIK